MNFDILLPSINRASKIALQIYGTDFSVETKQDGTPLTQADLVVNEILIQAIKDNFPDECIVSEESQIPQGEIPPDFFLIDPIDGTSDFVKRTGEWTINVAWIEERKAKWGCIAAPALGEFYCSSSLATCDIPLRDKVKILVSVSHRDTQTDELIKAIPNREEVSVGSSLKFCRLATGFADYYPRAVPLHEWDIAAGHAILKASGGNVFRIGSKDELAYGNPNFATPPFEAFRKNFLQFSNFAERGEKKREG